MKINFGKIIKGKSKDYVLSVNPALECLGVIYVLSNFELNTPRTNRKYLASIKGYFHDYENHPVVARFKELLTNEEFKYDAPVEIFLCMYNGVRPSKELLRRAKLTIKGYKEIIKLVKDFIKVSNFEKFIKKNEKYYQDGLNQFSNDMSQYTPVNYLFEFVGDYRSDLNVVLMFGVCTSNYGLDVDGLYCCVRPYDKSRSTNEIDFAYDKVYMTTLILHEFAHSFINPMTEEYRKDLKKINKADFKEIFSSHPYSDNIETAINELVIRAIECCYIKDNFKSSYFKFKNDYIEEGFKCIPDLEILYQDYLSKKNKYETLIEYYSNIINYFTK